MRLAEREEEQKILSVDELILRLKEMYDSNERLALLLDASAHFSREEFSILYQSLLNGVEQERHLVLQMWMRADQAFALDTIYQKFPGRLEEALEIALLENSAGAVAWVKHTGVDSLKVLAFQNRLPREEEIDQWMTLAAVSLEEDESIREEPEEAAPPAWVKDFPTGLSVEGTARQVVKIAATHPVRGRYWLSHSQDHRARARAASDIGWESFDLAQNPFDEWLSSLPQDIAQSVLEGRLERLAFENPDNPEFVLEEARRYEGLYNLDIPIWLIMQRINVTSEGELEIVNQLVGIIQNVEVSTLADATFVRPIIEFFDAQSENDALDSSASVAMASFAESVAFSSLSATALQRQEIELSPLVARLRAALEMESFLGGRGLPQP